MGTAEDPERHPAAARRGLRKRAKRNQTPPHPVLSLGLSFPFCEGLLALWKAVRPHGRRAVAFLSPISRALGALCPGLTPPLVPGKLGNVLAPLALCVPPTIPHGEGSLGPRLPPSSRTASSRQTDGIAPGLPKELRAGDVCTCLLSRRGLWTVGCPGAESSVGSSLGVSISGEAQAGLLKNMAQHIPGGRTWWCNQEAQKGQRVGVVTGKAAWRRRPRR